jgi:hypothetical protein
VGAVCVCFVTVIFVYLVLDKWILVSSALKVSTWFYSGFFFGLVCLPFCLGLIKWGSFFRMMLVLRLFILFF